MLLRDSTLMLCAAKRAADVSRRDWEIVPLSSEPLSPEQQPLAQQQTTLLAAHWRTLTWRHALQQDHLGDLRTLVQHLMSAHGLTYAVHHLVWTPSTDPTSPLRYTLTTEAVPVDLCESTTGRLRYLPTGYGTAGQDMPPGTWHVAVGHGLMRAAGYLYLGKHLALTDWLGYTERYGLPFPWATAPEGTGPGTTAWDQLRTTLAGIHGGGGALLSAGSTLQTLQVPGTGALPHPDLVDRMDRAMATLYRGADLSTMSRDAATSGVTAQSQETTLLVADDCAWATEQLRRLERYALYYSGLLPSPTSTPLVGIQLRAPVTADQRWDLELDRQLTQWGLPQDRSSIYTRYDRTPPDPTSTDLLGASPAPDPTTPDPAAPNTRTDDTPPTDTDTDTDPLRRAVTQDLEQALTALTTALAATDHPESDTESILQALRTDLAAAAEAVLTGDGAATALARQLTQHQLRTLLTTLGLTDSEWPAFVSTALLTEVTEEPTPDPTPP
jgi:hypothetical protein